MVIRWTLIFVNVILYLALIALWISIPDELTLNLSLSIFNLCLTTVLLIRERESLQKYYMSSQFKNLSSSLVTTFLIFCILGVLNYLIFKNPSQWDFSGDKQNSLSHQTIKVVKSLNSPLEVKVFANRAQFSAFRGLLELYQSEKNDVKVKYIDIELEPALVNKYRVQAPNTLIFEYLNREERARPVEFAGPPRQIVPPGELQITNALVKISREKDIQILYSTGHGEESWDNREGIGFSHLKKILSEAAFSVEAFPFLERDKIPQSADIFVIWGPQDDFSSRELGLLKEFLDKGGNLAIALDTNLNGDRLPDLRAFLIDRGVRFHNDLVIDQLKHIQGSNGSVPLVDRPNSKHPISKNIKSPIFFPLVGGVEGGESSVALAQSTAYPGSWGERSPKEFITGKVSFNEGVDAKGPMTMALIQKDEDKKNKILALGNSTLVSNTYAKFSGNFNFILNSFSWMANEDRLISFDVPNLANRPVFISRPQLGIIFYFSVVFAPLVLIGFSIFLYRRRLTL